MEVNSLLQPSEEVENYHRNRTAARASGTGPGGRKKTTLGCGALRAALRSREEVGAQEQKGNNITRDRLLRGRGVLRIPHGSVKDAY
ncbi:unnamed protein product [Amoebophrya sp. A25]|nr:unnamed protein product [Amoebophrya sp. A25]|eukprot:GSA25T00012028001.1